MKPSIIERHANLHQYPEVIDYKHQDTHVSVGDLHGNALKLIYVLIEEDILQLSPDQYRLLHHIYYKETAKLTSTDILNFRTIIQGAQVNKHRALTLIGDELADRGQNDLFTLFVLDKLHRDGLDMDIMVSNHSMEFIRDYERRTFTGQYALMEGQGRSLANMQYLLHKGIVSEEAVRDIVNQSYIPMVKAIGYTLSPQGDLTIFSHAPIGLETVQGLAKRFQIPYHDRSVEELIRTIEGINTQVRQRLTQKQLSGLMDGSTRAPISPYKYPFTRLVWNRTLGDELQTKPHGDFKVHFVHGHIGEGDVLHHGQPIPTHQNLDTFFGKEQGDEITGPSRYEGEFIHHFTRHSSDMTAKQLARMRRESANTPQAVARDPSVAAPGQFIENPLYRAPQVRVETFRSASPDILNLQRQFNESLSQLEELKNELQTKAQVDKQYQAASTAAIRLHRSLNNLGTQFFNPKGPMRMTPLVFKVRCETAIANAEVTLKKHHNTWYRMSGIIRGILGVVAAATILPGLAVKAFSNKGFKATFFSTPLDEKLRGIRNTYNAVMEDSQPRDDIESIENPAFKKE